LFFVLAIGHRHIISEIMLASLPEFQVRQIALTLRAHTTIEEDIFYAEDRGEVEDDLLDQAQVERDGAKRLA
jgi:hypothetical protein